MALKDWRLFVEEDLPSNDAFASVDPRSGRKIGRLHFSEDFLNHEDPKEQRQTIVHELVHCLQAPFIRALTAKGWEDPATTLAMEYTTDAIADAWAPFLPLPPNRVRSKP